MRRFPTAILAMVLAAGMAGTGGAGGALAVAGAGGGDVSADARHPRIALRSSTEVVIFFQAKPSGPADTAYLLYRALLTLDNNVVVSQSVLPVEGVSPGNIEHVSFGLVAADNTPRPAY